jgi:hypothetical protein
MLFHIRFFFAKVRIFCEISIAVFNAIFILQGQLNTILSQMGILNLAEEGRQTNHLLYLWSGKTTYF